MKEKRFIQNSSRVIAAFLLTGAMSVAIWSVVTYDRPKSMYYAQDKGNNSEMNSTLNNLFSNAYMKYVEKINLEIGKLEQKKAMVMSRLEKANADRNKTYGMVAGMYFQPAQDVAEIVVLEGEVNQLDHKIAALSKGGRNLALK